MPRNKSASVFSGFVVAVIYDIYQFETKTRGGIARRDDEHFSIWYDVSPEDEVIEALRHLMGRHAVKRILILQDFLEGFRYTRLRNTFDKKVPEAFEFYWKEGGIPHHMRVYTRSLMVTWFKNDTRDDAIRVIELRINLPSRNQLQRELWLATLRTGDTVHWSKPPTPHKAGRYVLDNVYSRFGVTRHVVEIDGVKHDVDVGDLYPTQSEKVKHER